MTFSPPEYVSVLGLSASTRWGFRGLSPRCWQRRVKMLALQRFHTHRIPASLLRSGCRWVSLFTKKVAHSIQILSVFTSS